MPTTPPANDEVITTQISLRGVYTATYVGDAGPA